MSNHLFEQLMKLATIQLTMEPCDDPLIGNVSCIDEKIDAENVAWVCAQLDSGNDWAWCDVTITATFAGLKATDILSQCSYRSETEFREGGYYDNMVFITVHQLLDQLEYVYEQYKQLLSNY